MQYISTRDKNTTYLASQAIAQGLAPDGGLMTPAYLPKLPGKSLSDLKEMSYQQRAVYIMKLFLDEFSVKELTEFAAAAYGPEKFDTPAVAPVRALDDGTFCLELWHGPTCAFKDMALQMLPHLLTASLVKTEEEKTVCILVATSGDTGKGALEGFRDVDRTRILVFYPKDGVSAIQELQMVTQEGKNVGVCSVFGNFDDAQTGVKKLFSDEALRQELARRGYFLSSANSINWGRVLPQIVYYISAYCDLLRDEKIQRGEKVNVCVPTGNFGNILAAYIAKQMGLPVNKFICASNRNNVLTDFFKKGGEYNRNRDFFTTTSPSMDILISSNLERLLFFASDFNDKLVAELMNKLNTEGSYKVAEDVFAKIEVFRLDDNRHDRKVVHDNPIAAWSFTGDLRFGGDNLCRLVSGRFDFRLYLSQVAVIKREHGVPAVYRIAFLTHLPEHFPFQPCKGSVQFNYRGTELLYGLCLPFRLSSLMPSTMMTRSLQVMGYEWVSGS